MSAVSSSGEGHTLITENNPTQQQAKTADGFFADQCNSEVSKSTPAEEMVARSNIPSVYKVPNTKNPTIYQIQSEKSTVSSPYVLKRCKIGQPSDIRPGKKTIMLLGATGAGKSTLIDGIANYVYGVAWEDYFRLRLVDLSKEEHERLDNQAVSQTEYITLYELHPFSGCAIDYTLEIIDTPGFGDTRGIERDHQIVKQIHDLFSKPPEQHGVEFIDAVCFVVQAPLARLTATQRYIFDSILSIFGKDIIGNIVVLVTFADGAIPPVLGAMKSAEIPYAEHAIFNNSALFTDTTSGTSRFSKMFWELGKDSFQTFFNTLNLLQKKSLCLTAQVLQERARVEATIQGLIPAISKGLNQVASLEDEQRILKQHQLEIDSNKDFEYIATEWQIIKINLRQGEYVTNCLICNCTCHYPCGIPNNEGKIGCAAMTNCYCTVCDKKCFWDKHVNNPFRFETKEVKVPKVYSEKKKKLEEAQGQKEQKLTVIQRMEGAIQQAKDKVSQIFQALHKSVNHLKNIALKSNPLSEIEYIDLLIEKEKKDKQPGFRERIESLNELRRMKELENKASDPNYNPLA